MIANEINERKKRKLEVEKELKKIEEEKEKERKRIESEKKIRDNLLKYLSY